MIAGISLYGSVSIPNLRTLARMPVLQQQESLPGRIRRFLAHEMVPDAEAAKIPEPLSNEMRYECISLLAAANNLIIAALIGVLLFQGAQAYAHAQYRKELAKLEAQEAKKTQ